MQIEFDSKVYGKIKIDIEAFLKNFKRQILSYQKFVYYDFETTSGHVRLNSSTKKYLEIICQCSLIVCDLDYKDHIFEDNLYVDLLNYNEIDFYKDIIDIIYKNLINNGLGIIFEKTAELHWLKMMAERIKEKEYYMKAEFVINHTLDLRDFFYNTYFCIQILDPNIKSSLKSLCVFKNSQCDLIPYDELEVHTGRKVNLITFDRLLGKIDDTKWKKYIQEFLLYCKNDVLSMINQVLNLRDLYKELNERV